MKFSAKKFMSLVFAAGSAAATLPSLSVLGDRYTADGRRVQLTGFENGTIEMRLLGGKAFHAGRWAAIVDTAYCLDTIDQTHLTEATAATEDPADLNGYGASHPRVNVVSGPSGHTFEVFNLFTFQGGYETIVISPPGVRLDVLLHVDMRPGPFGAVAQCQIFLTRLNNDRTWAKGTCTQENVLTDSLSDCGNALDLTVQACLPGEVDHSPGEKVFRVFFINEDDNQVMSESYDLSPTGRYEERELQAIADTTGKRVVYPALNAV